MKKELYALWIFLFFMRTCSDVCGEEFLPVSNEDIGASLAVGENFKGISLLDESTNVFPPDTMGAVGPKHFVEVIKGAVGIYTKSGVLQGTLVTLDDFFGLHLSKVPAFDPRVLFDKQSGRWFASALETNNSTNNDLLLAVSRTDDPTGAWDKYVISVGELDLFNQYETLGVDTNGIYFGLNAYDKFGNFRHARVIATPISSLVSAAPSLGPVYISNPYTDMFGIQPAHHQDAISSTAPAYFVSRAQPDVGANVVYRTLTWSSGTPSFSNLFTVSTPPYGSGQIQAPALNSTTNIATGDSRLQMAVIRNNRLWTCRKVNVNSGGTANNPDRTAAEFLELDLSTSPAVLVQSGRAFDNAVSNFHFYYYPSLMVNAACDVVMGFSGSSAADYIGAYACGRLGSNLLGTIGPVNLLKAGVAAYNLLDSSGKNAWGNYSYTSLDPDDEMAFWTIQEYAEGLSGGNSIWGTHISQIILPSHPANGIINGSATVCSGNNSGTLNLSGQTGLVAHWEFSTDGGATWTAIANSAMTTTQTYKNLTTTTEFRAVIAINPCFDDSSIATISVIPVPDVIATPASQTICSGSLTDISLTSNSVGSTFSWTVVQNGTSGASSGSGNKLAQILTATTSSAGTVVYTITPTAANGCLGEPITVTVTVNPLPVATAKPASQAICSGSATNISLASNHAGTTFSWTVVQNGISGASSGAGNTIVQALTATTSFAGTAVYTITPIAANGCVGEPITVTVTVNPLPVATATPASQTICSGSATNISLASNHAGTTFSWTVVQNGVSGAWSGSGNAIAQTLTATTNSAGTAVYTLTPTAANGCVGAPISITVIVDPLPVAIATPASQTIGSGSETNVFLTSNSAGTTFSWTVVQNGASGALDGSGNTIGQTLTAITNSPGSAVYTITPTSANGCTGNPLVVTVTVNPIPTVTATPSNQSIMSGATTNIHLSSNVAGTVFDWTVEQRNASGASNGSGSIISQTLMAAKSTGIVIYTVVPTANGYEGDPLKVLVTIDDPAPAPVPVPRPPGHFRGVVKKNRFASQADFIHVLSWERSHDSSVAGYRLYQDGRLIKAVSKSGPFRISLHHRKPKNVYTYTLTTVYSSGMESSPSYLTMP